MAFAMHSLPSAIYYQQSAIPMTRYIIRRVLQAIPLLLLFSFTIFMIMQLIPGGPLAAYENNPNISPEDLERLRHELGLDTPIHIQYLNWLGSVLRGDWGTSQITRRPALVEIGEKLPNTIYLSLIAFFGALLISIPIGITSAIRQYSWFDHLSTTVAFIGQSMPVFWLAAILLYFFTFKIELFPTSSYIPLTKDPLKWASHLILPWLTLAILYVGFYSRVLRSNMLDVMNEDYVRTARAKGITERQVRIKHVLRNSMIPIVTLFGLDFGAVVGGGAILTETVFNINGVGLYAGRAIGSLDLPPLMGVTMFGAFFIVFFNTVVDILYAFLDPRIRLGEAAAA